MTPELLLLFMLIALCVGLLSGFPVAFVLAGVALLTALAGDMIGIFDLVWLQALPNRIFGIMTNELLLAVPLFVFMGVMLEKARIAEELLTTMADLMGNIRSGLGLSVIIVGALLAASTGIVGATVITMGLISLPVMLKANYDPKISTGVICASGTLGQIIPPSIVLILLGDQISSAHTTVQMSKGNLSADPVSVADLFMGALLPGLMLVFLYGLWLVIYGRFSASGIPPVQNRACNDGLLLRAVKVLLPPLALIVLVLGSILGGFATATESASVGAAGAMLLAAFRKRLTFTNIKNVCQETTRVTCMVFTILIGAAFFTLVFRGLHGDDMIHEFLSALPGGLLTALLLTMVVMFLLGFFLDFIEIIFVVVPIVAPVLLAMGADPVWLAIMIAVNLQTSFLTPPFGFALFYLRGVAPKSVTTVDIYKGVMPFVVIQLIMLSLLAFQPKLATWLPNMLYHDGKASFSAAKELELEEGGIDSYSEEPEYSVDF